MMTVGIPTQAPAQPQPNAPRRAWLNVYGSLPNTGPWYGAAYRSKEAALRAGLSDQTPVEFIELTPEVRLAIESFNRGSQTTLAELVDYGEMMVDPSKLARMREWCDSHPGYNVRKIVKRGRVVGLGFDKGPNTYTLRDERYL